MRIASRNHFIGKTTCGNHWQNNMRQSAIVPNVATYRNCFDIYRVFRPIYLAGVTWGQKCIKEPALDRRPFRQIQKTLEMFFLNAKRFKPCSGGT